MSGEPTPIDWLRIERFMLRAFRGETLTPAEAKLIEEAFTRDPKEYGRRSKEVRAQEIARIRSGS